MKAITFLLYLEEPFLATQVNNGEPNSGVSYPFIPGSMIRGAFVRRYLNGRILDLAADEKGRDLFLNGKVRYLNAYLYHDSHRLLPTPRSWFVEKGEEDNATATIADFAVRLNAERGDDALRHPKSLGQSFTPPLAGRPTLRRPLRRVTVHNTTGQPGRKQEGISQIYRYDALAPRQTFQGVIVADDDVDLSKLTAGLEGAAMTLGGSSTGGYGLVSVQDVSPPTASWQEYKADTPPDGCHILTCLSDVIVRTPDGQISAALARTLGIDPDAVTAFQDARVVGGFNKKWGLPLPQAWAIQAGSVFRIQAKAIPRNQLEQMVRNGIGERRAEGFGRLALNWHTQATKQRKQAAETVADMAGELSDRSHDLAQRMANRRLQIVLEEKLQALINRRQQFTRLPSPTQLSRVRLAARHALAKGDLSGIAAHMDALKGARAQWEGAKVGKEDLRSWIKVNSRLDKDEFSQRFELDATLPQIAGVTVEPSDAIMTEYSARLIDGVMKVAVEQAKQNEEGKR